ncbi:hypothetical protein, partial [Methylobacterium indicum]|uniref:hypothetical protein n=1 Tax=Methylobacterium indicum TaxID=1775910 RepID=UPI001AD8B2CF
GNAQEGEQDRDAIAVVHGVCIPCFSASHHTTYVPGTMRGAHGCTNDLRTSRLYMAWLQLAQEHGLRNGSPAAFLSQQVNQVGPSL